MQCHKRKKNDNYGKKTHNEAKTMFEFVFKFETMNYGKLITCFHTSETTKLRFVFTKFSFSVKIKIYLHILIVPEKWKKSWAIILFLFILEHCESDVNFFWHYRFIKIWILLHKVIGLIVGRTVRCHKTIFSQNKHEIKSSQRSEIPLVTFNCSLSLT